MIKFQNKVSNWFPFYVILFKMLFTTTPPMGNTQCLKMLYFVQKWNFNKIYYFEFLRPNLRNTWNSSLNKHETFRHENSEFFYQLKNNQFCLDYFSSFSPILKFGTKNETFGTLCSSKGMFQQHCYSPLELLASQTTL